MNQLEMDDSGKLGNSPRLGRVSAMLCLSLYYSLELYFGEPVLEMYLARVLVWLASFNNHECWRELTFEGQKMLKPNLHRNTWQRSVNGGKHLCRQGVSYLKSKWLWMLPSKFSQICLVSNHRCHGDGEQLGNKWATRKRILFLWFCMGFGWTRVNSPHSVFPVLCFAVP